MTSSYQPLVLPGHFDVILVPSAHPIRDVSLLTITLSQVGPAHIPEVGSKPTHTYLGEVGDDFIQKSAKHEDKYQVNRAENKKYQKKIRSEFGQCK